MHTSILQGGHEQVCHVGWFSILQIGIFACRQKNDAAKVEKDVMELVSNLTKGDLVDKVLLVIVLSSSNGVENS